MSILLKKFFLILLFFIFLFSNKSFANNEIDVSNFIDEAKEYSNELFPELSDESWINNILNRRYKFKWKRFN